MTKLERLEEFETSTALWAKLKSHIEKDLENLRKSNDGIGNDPVQTAFIRGRIAQLKSLLALERGPEQVADDGI